MQRGPVTAFPPTDGFESWVFSGKRQYLGSIERRNSLYSTAGIQDKAGTHAEVTLMNVEQALIL
jgi:hypothetical protein